MDSVPDKWCSVNGALEAKPRDDQHFYTIIRVSSRNFISGGEAHGSRAVWPRRGEGRLHNYNILGGKLGQFGGGGGGGR